MAYTDIWRCKHCNVLPDIQMVGKSFYIVCQNCEDRDCHVEAESLDEVVSLWNRRHEPAKPATGLLGKFQQLAQLVKDSAEYQLEAFREKRERSARIKRSIQEIRESEVPKEEPPEPLLDEACVEASEAQDSRC